jgi:DNA-binding winged helix-turn-helix (wHTH) protein
MRTGTDPDRVGSLVVELGARTAIIDGGRIELPQTEFALLSVLASRPGEIVSHKELATAAFGEAAPVMAPHELHNRIYRLRKLLDDVERKHKLIENRRGQGYVLNLPTVAVEVLEGVAGLAVTDVAQTTEPSIPSVVELPEADVPPQVKPAEPPRPDRATLRPRVVVAASLAAAVALSGSWLAGYVLSNRSAAQPETTLRVAENDTRSEREPAKEKRRESGRDKDRRRNGNKRNKGSDRQVASAPVIAAPGSSSEVPATTPDQSESSQGSRDTSRKRPPEPALPAAPTRYLYHLEHPETGDHFVTTDGNIVSTYEGRGYVGGAIGRIYTSAPEGVATKSISTNRGTAYIFSNSSAKTEPASSMVPLYYSTNNDGDFFYTTSAGEAKATGWEGVQIGYVRTLG